MNAKVMIFVDPITVSGNAVEVLNPANATEETKIMERLLRGCRYVEMEFATLFPLDTPAQQLGVGFTSREVRKVLGLRPGASTPRLVFP